MGTNKGITEIQAGYNWDCGSSVGFKYIKIICTSQNVVLCRYFCHSAIKYRVIILCQ